MKISIININDYTNEEYKKWYDLLYEEKKHRVDKLRNPKPTIAGEILSKKMIGECLNIPPETIIIKTTPKGKPYAEGLNIHFNISHSGELVACAINDTEIGIDIEKIRKINLKIAKKICLENELNYIFDGNEIDYTSTNPKHIERFFEIWTGKEAYFKYLGTGISDFKEVDTLNLQKLHRPVYHNNEYILRVAY